ncbi:hypothetical protein EWI61_08990 [Methylolobus aquaticus]|nr:hypothetical protein EWI61_08990 [Methylolobus aquaticus]
MQMTAATRKQRASPKGQQPPVKADISATYAKLPDEVRNLKARAFIVWKKKWDAEKKKFTKPPHNPKTGKQISIKEEKKDFVSFAEALEAKDRLNMDGVGLVLTLETGISAIDFDHCIKDGKIDPDVLEFIRGAKSYAERSPSGDGIRVLYRTPPEGGVACSRNRERDMYRSDGHRYVTLTGDALDDLKGFSPTLASPSRAFLEGWRDRWHGKGPQEGSSKPHGEIPPAPPEEFLPLAADIGALGLSEASRLFLAEGKCEDGSCAAYLAAIELAKAGLSAEEVYATLLDCHGSSALVGTEKRPDVEWLWKYCAWPAYSRESPQAHFDVVAENDDFTGVLPRGKRGVTLMCAADVVPEKINWIWRDWLAAGKLHIAAGVPGCGKTTLALSLAAIVSSGGCWPDGTKAPKGTVLIWSGEDDIKDTLVPRLIASGADSKKVHFLSGVIEKGESRPFDPATDCALLESKLSEITDVALLIVDPIVSAVAGDSHKNSEVRRGLQPLVDLGQRTGIAIFGISHLAKGTAGKSPNERVIGSQAFVACSRLVFHVVRMPKEEGGGRAIMRGKNNMGKDDGGIRYDIEEKALPKHPGITATAVVWGAAIEGTAQEILAQAEAEDSGSRSAKEEAEEFLKSVLKDEPIPSRELRKLAEREGYAWSTIKRAKEALGVLVNKEGFGKKSGWVWRLPEEGSPDAAAADFGIEGAGIG